MSEYNKQLAQALRRFITEGIIVSDDYSAIRGHAVATSEDRATLGMWLFGKGLEGDRERLLALADRIMEHPW